MDISFSGAGFMGCYYFGVVDCLNRYIPRNRINRVAGASAGSLIAAYYLMDLPLRDSFREITTMTEEIRKRPLGVFDRNHQIVDMLPKILDRILPDDSHKRVSGRLYVSMTRLKDMKNVIISEFESKKDLIDALNCSCFIPVWSGNHTSSYKGVKYIDGGLSDNLPIFDEHTIKVCCFAGHTDISPYDSLKSELLSGSVYNTSVYFNFANMRRLKKALSPPSASSILDVLERGFQNAKEFILKNDLIQCDNCYRKFLHNRPFTSSLSSTVSPCESPTLARAASRRFNSSNDVCNFSQNLSISNSPDKTCDLDFNQKLSAKLKSYSTSEDLNNNNVKGTRNPSIVIEDTSDNNEKAQEFKKVENSSTENDTSKHDEAHEANLWKERFIARRATILNQETSLLVVQDKFKSSQVPLPSCPPSPNLNRHCVECLRLRQEARMDKVEDEIRAEVVKFLPSQAYKESNFKNKLTSPIKWMRQLKRRSSYTFVDAPTLTAV